MVPDFFARLRTHVTARPDHPVFQYLGPETKDVYTFGTVWVESARLAGHLVDQGVEPGARVGIVMEDGPAWAVCFLGVLSAGCIAVPFDTQHPTNTLARLIEHAGCQLILSSPAIETKLEEAQRALSRRAASLIVASAASPGAWLIAASTRGGNDAWQSSSASAFHHPVRARGLDDPLAILYTSGTTGDPKGVVLTGRNVFRNVDETLKIIQVYPTDHMLSVLPLYHTLALVISLVVPLFAGFTVSFLNVLEPQRILKAFRDEGITIFVCVPQFFYLMHRRILREVEQSGWLVRFLFRRMLGVSRMVHKNLGINAGRIFFRSVHKPFGSDLRLFGVGGARFEPAVQTNLENLGFPFVQAYGMTETAALITVAPPVGNEIGSVGRPLPHVNIAIDRPNAEGIGEVIVRGENIMQGYWKNPEATAEALKDGWLHTGDSGYISPRGYLHLTGRTKDVIVLSSGKNVNPEEVEHHYAERCPEIKEICVLGVADDSQEGREKLHAVVVPDFDYLRKRKIVNSADATRFAIENASQGLPTYQRVNSYEIRREPLPRTTTRKIRRFQLAEEIRSGREREAKPSAGSSATPSTAAERTIYAAIRGMKRSADIRPEMNLELDLGFDSLERVELLSSLQESFGVQLSDEQLSAVLTVEDLVGLLEDRATGAERQDAAVSWPEILRKPLRPEDERKLREILRRRPGMELFLYVAARFATLLSKALFRFRVGGMENLPADYPFLICPNHLSYLDVCFLVMALPWRVVRRQFFLGYTNFFESGLLGFIGRRIKVIPVDPDRALRQSLRLGAEGLRGSTVLIVFPEGERSIDGTLKSFRKGPAILATELAVPVVPVGIRGTFEVWPRGRSRLRLHPVSIRFGAPVVPAPGEAAEDFNARLYAAVKGLLD